MADPIKITKEGLPVYDEAMPLKITKEGLPIFTSPGQAPRPVKDVSITPGEYSSFATSLPKAIPPGLAIAGGILGGPAGAGLGTVAGTELKNEFPGTFGEAPSTGEVLTETALNTLPLESLVARGLKGSIGKFLSSKLVRNISPSVKAAREGERLSDIGTKAASYIQNPELSTLPESGLSVTRGPKGQFQQSNTFTPGYNQQLRAGQEELNSLVNSGYSPATNRLDAVKVLDNLVKNPNEYRNVDPIVKNNFKEFLQEAIAQKPLAKEGGDKLINYARNRFILGAGIGAVTGGILPGTVAGGGLVLGEAAIKQALKDPVISKLMLTAIKTPASAPEASFISKVLINALRGADVVALTPDGEEKGQIGSFGFEPAR